MHTKPRTKKKFELFEPVKVFIALMIAALLWVAPVAFPQWETKPGEPETRSLTVLPQVNALPPDICSDACKVWYCDNKIPGGPCLEWTFHCAGCDGGEGGNQPPVISHILNCSNTGNNGWCIGTLSIDLSASDPQGQSLIISGDLNGNNFTCPNGDVTCSIPLLEGTGSVNYKVDSATGLSATGTTTYQLDVITPQISGNISGSTGLNGWYTSQTLANASASDFISGVTSLEINVDNTGYTVYADTTFIDGVHTIQYRACDAAGNCAETAVQTIMVDTVTPSLSLQVDGTSGHPSTSSGNWYVSGVSIQPVTSDTTSGVALIEAAIDGSAFAPINSAIPFADGIHTYQVRVIDYAGNVITSPVQTISIDVSPPAIAMDDDSLTLGETLYYSLEDSLSGLSQLRVVIEDEDEKYKKVVWLEDLSGKKFNSIIRWDGKFADGTYAAPGTYYITIKVTNGAGVESIRAATIEVPVVKTTEQESIPALILPASAVVIEPTQDIQPEPAPQGFGNTTPSQGNAFAGTSIQTSFTAGNQTTSTQSTTTSNILWGGAAAALLGGTLAEWQKKRQEEAARLAALQNNSNDEEGYDDSAARRQEQKIAKTNPALANAMKRERELKAAIAQVTAQELKGTNVSVAQAQARQQAQWDANGAAIYDANQQFKETYGKEMDAATKEQAIKDATVNGVFNAGLYAINLNTAQQQQQAKIAKNEECEQTLQDYHAGERDAVAIAEEYQREEAAQSYRAGERNAVAIAEGYKSQVRKEGDRQYDLTSWLPLVINRNLQSPELRDMKFYNKHIGGTGPWLLELFGDFRTLNTGGGRWDIKLEMQDEFRNGLGDKDAAHILCSNSGTCQWVDYSTAGNILYGATAADAGVPRWMSKLAGGLLEIWEGTAKGNNWWNLGEDPYDTNAVNFGYDLYESTDGNITEEAFRDALTDEVLNSLQPPPEGFTPPFEAQPQPNTYLADRFDQPEEKGTP